MFRPMKRLSGICGVGSFMAFNTASTSTSCAEESKKVFDLVVIGGGSGGLACAKRAAGYGAKVAIVEGKEFGGTCVNVGCVPKKIMYNAAHVAETLHEAKSFHLSGVQEVKFDWSGMKSSRDAYIKRLNGIYERGLDKLHITRVNGFASFEDANTIRVGDEVLSAKNVLIAVGGAANKLGVRGEEHVLDSDGFFALESQPRNVAVIGAGYIAVELAGVFNGLGSRTSLFVRGDRALRSFDSMISEHLDKSMKKGGINVVAKATTEEVIKEKDGSYTLKLKNGDVHRGFDCVIAATGRHPLTAPLRLDKAGVATNEKGYIAVDEYQNTNVPNVYALGDVCGVVELTPMAIAAGRRLADRVFDGETTAKASYDLVPTVVFSHPVIGTIGLTEAEAVKKYGKEDLTVYTSDFVNLYYASFYNGGPGEKPISKYKVICQGANQKVVGLHMIGQGSDEVLQGFGVAMKMGATKADFDSCIAIHPTAAEEMVTLAPWGTSHRTKK